MRCYTVTALAVRNGLAFVGFFIALLSLPALGQNSVVTYQGLVTSNGTNFTGAGQFKVALVTVTNNNNTATATANPPSGGFITVIAVTSPGTGYVSPPAVTITGGGGSGATAAASLSGGSVSSISVSNPGSGYTSAPTVLIAPPPASLVFATHWSNDGTSSAGSEPANAISAAVVNGLFTLRLGDATIPNMTALNASLFQRPNLELRLWFNNGVNAFAVLSPTQPLTVTPYAAFAATANAVTAGSNQPVNLSVNGINVLRIMLTNDLINGFGTTANSVGGSPANVLSNGVVGGFIGGGGSTFYPNRVGANYASVLGGLDNTASGIYSTAMGAGTTASGNLSTTMGNGTTASGSASTAMGSGTTASGNSSTAMGNRTTASNTYAMAMGYRAKAIYRGSLVWADSQNTDFISTTNDQFRIRAAGGMEVVGGTNTVESFRYSGVRSGGFAAPVGYGENNNTSGNSGPALRLVSKGGNSTDGVLSVSSLGTGDLAAFGNSSAFVSRLSNNGTWTALAFNPTSDRQAKENFIRVDSQEVLAKVVALPLARWNYKAVPGVDHVGPVAQDFHAAFGLNGTDDKHIATVDADGVALAAIQGLNDKLEARSQKLEQENAELKARLEKLERILSPSERTANKHER